MTTLAYDGSGRLTSTAFNALGMPTGVTDATSKTVSTSYDNLGRVRSVTAPGSRTTTFPYDLAGNKTGVTDAGNPSSPTGVACDILAEERCPHAAHVLVGGVIIRQLDQRGVRFR